VYIFSKNQETNCLEFVLFWPQIGHAVRCPASKFITHTLSHICFLILLTLATFRLEGHSRIMSTNGTSVNSTTGDMFSEFEFTSEQERRDKVEQLLKESFRPVNKLITEIQICLVFWVLGRCLLFSLFSLSSAQCEFSKISQ